MNYDYFFFECSLILGISLTPFADFNIKSEKIFNGSPLAGRVNSKL